MKKATTAAQANNRSRRCYKCPILHGCSPDIAAACVRAFKIGFKTGYRLAKNKNKLNESKDNKDNTSGKPA